MDDVQWKSQLSHGIVALRWQFGNCKGEDQQVKVSSTC